MKPQGEIDREKEEGEEDRISELPDELIHHIFSYLDSRMAVRTCVVSKRWKNLWTTLSCLNYRPISNHDNCNKFITNFFEYRNQQSVISTVTINCYRGDISVLSHVLHNVENLRICNGHFRDSSCIFLAFIKTLHLTRCGNVHPVSWKLPSLTALYLEDVYWCDQILGFQNLTELTISGFVGFEMNTIYCPNLQSLTLTPHFPPWTLLVFAPKLSSFKFHSSRIPTFCAGNIFSCLKEVDIDIASMNDECASYDEDTLEGMMQNFVTMLYAVKVTPVLKLSSKTIQVSYSLYLTQYT